MASSAPKDLSGESAWETQAESPDDRHLRELRQILLGSELSRLEELEHRLGDPELRTQELSGIVAEAIAIRARRDRAVQRTLHPLVEDALRLSVERNPKVLADALFPIIGEAVRKAVAHALRGMVESLNQMMERSLSLESMKWRVEAVRTGKSFGEVALMRSLRYRVEQVFLIHRETGLLLHHVAAPGQVVQDTDLVSGMLTAVQDFVRDSFGGRPSEDLETMQVGQYTVWIVYGPQALLAAVVSGTPPPELRTVFQRAMEQVHQQFGSALQSFRGDAGPWEASRPGLQACLLGQPVIETRKSRQWVWALLLVTVVVVASSLYFWQRQRRWDQFLLSLQAEPGIVVTFAEKGWRSYSVAGLRDPMARDPRQILHSSGIEADRVSFHWSPYLSQEPALVAGRRLVELQQQIEQSIIRFEMNSPKLDRSELVKLDALEVHLGSLQQLARATGRGVKVEVQGHADSIGQESANDLLSRQRSEEVIRSLTDRGMDGQMLVAVGAGARLPGQHAGRAYRDDLNRRVTFRVVISAAGDGK